MRLKCTHRVFALMVAILLVITTISFPSTAQAVEGNVYCQTTSEDGYEFQSTITSYADRIIIQVDLLACPEGTTAVDAIYIISGYGDIRNLFETPTSEPGEVILEIGDQGEFNQIDSDTLYFYADTYTPDCVLNVQDGTLVTGTIFTATVPVKENGWDGTEMSGITLEYDIYNSSSEWVAKYIYDTITIPAAPEAVEHTGGSISAGDYNVIWGYGGEVVESEDGNGYIITPAEGYTIDQIWVDGALDNENQEKYQSVIGGSDQASYTWTGNEPQKSLVVYFTYTVNFEQPTNGTLSVSRGVEELTSGSIVHGGDVLTITATPASGNDTLGELNLEGITDNKNGTYTVTAKKGEKTPSISADFVLSKYSLTAAPDPDDHGSIGFYTSGNNEIDSAEKGETVYVRVSPNPFYELSYLELEYRTEDGETHKERINEGSTSFIMPAGNTRVTPHFIGAMFSYDFSISLSPNVEATEYNVAIYDSGKELLFNQTINKETLLEWGVEPADSMSYLMNEKTFGVSARYGDKLQLVLELQGSTILKDEPYSTMSSVEKDEKESNEEKLVYDIIVGAEKTNNNGYYRDRIYIKTRTSKMLTIMQTGEGTVVPTEEDGFELPTPAGNGSYFYYSNFVIKVKPEDGWYWKSQKHTSDEKGENDLVCSFFCNKDPTNYYFGASYNSWLWITFEKLSDLAERHEGFEYRAEDKNSIWITNEAGLRTFAELVNSGVNFYGVTFKLDDNIKLTRDWTPISEFWGTFDGNGKTISNMNITDIDGVTSYGLFGSVRYGSIENLTVEGSIHLTSASRYVGGIIGFGVYRAYDLDGGTTELGCTLINCTSKVDIHLENNASWVGGMAGSVYCVSDCINLGELTLDNSKATSSHLGALWPYVAVGGVVGYMSGNEAGNCGNYGNISITERWTETSSSTASTSIYQQAYALVGGIIGTTRRTGTGHMEGDPAREITITGCFNKGSITNHFRQAGGILGEAYGGNVVIQNCYNTGAISQTAKGEDNKAFVATVRLGGIIGCTNYAYSSDKYGDYTLEIINCYSTTLPTCEQQYTWMGIGELHGNDTSDSYNGRGTWDTPNSYGYDSLSEENLGKLIAVDDGSVYMASELFGYPVLCWEKDIVDPGSHKLTITVSGEEGTRYTAALYKGKDADGELIQSYDKNIGENTTFDGLEAGAYYYVVTSDGCVADQGVSIISMVDAKTSAALRKGTDMQFKVTPTGADFSLSRSGSTVKCSKIEGNDGYDLYTYKDLYVDDIYTYSATKEDMYGDAKSLIAKEGKEPVAVTLEPAETDGEYRGSIESGKEWHISEGGIYDLTPGVYGSASKIYIETSAPVTLRGKGTADSGKCEDVYIKYTTEYARLKLQDVFLSNSTTSGAANMVDFTGKDNVLEFAGANVLEQDTDDSGCAMIHVGPDTELTIRGKTAYLYKSEIGAGIGGNGFDTGTMGADSSVSPEVCGKITFDDAVLFMKGTKTGALIGSGGDANNYTLTSFVPGQITITDSVLNLIANARGAAIGGGAGSIGGVGGPVSITGSMVNINVNHTGAAIGGGGGTSSNDANGGSLTVSNSLLRTYASANVVGRLGYFKYITEAGVNSHLITADYRGQGLKLNFAGLPAGSFTVYGIKNGAEEEKEEIYSGNTLQYRDVSEVTGKSGSNTIDNWVEVEDPEVYLTGIGAYDSYQVDSGGKAYPLKPESGWYVLSMADKDDDENQDNNDNQGKEEHQHRFGAWKTVTAATCTKAGTEKRTCTSCGKEETRTVAALGHSYGKAAYSWNTAGTQCTAKAACTRCGSAVTETVKATGKVTKAATTSAAGNMRYTAVFKNSLFTVQTKDVSIPKLPAAPVTKPAKPAKPAKVASFKLSSTSSTSQKLTWKAVKGATGYRIIRYSSAGKQQKAYTTTKTSLTVTKLNVATTYKYKISAYAKNTAGTTYGTASKALTVTTAPAKVTISKATVKTSKSTATVTVKWKKGKGNGYQIQYTTDKKFKKSVKSYTVKSIKTTSKKLTIKKNKKYYIRIRAYRTLNKKKYYGAWSKVKMAG